MGNSEWACKTCAYSPPIGTEAFKTIAKTYLRDYGNVSVARLKALDSRKILPYAPADGSYCVGTRLPSGKVIERTPDISP